MFYYTVALLIFMQNIKPSVLSPIVGGSFVKTKGAIKYPFMVSLQERKSESISNNVTDYEHFCGASLLNSKWILSAGHCLWNKNITNVFAVIGYENIKTVWPEHHFAVERVEYFFFHPTNLQNDIALLCLQKPYTAGLNVYNNDLPYGKLPSGRMKDYRNSSCKIIGFGATKHAGLIQQQLNEAEVNVITDKRCRQLLGHVWAPQEGDNTVCALGNAQDTCQGDSGGPLICKYNENDYIYGIIASGLICGIKGMPGIYTRIDPYLEWINFIINE